MLCVIDHYDSFTYNLVQAFAELGWPARVVPNDRIRAGELASDAPSGIVLSPGPGGPEGTGATLEVIRRLAGVVPILGVCLGHQAIAAAFGGRVRAAGRVVHGKASPVDHDGRGVFRGLPQPMLAGRYHSLVVEAASLPADFEVSARTRSSGEVPGEIMGIRHRRYPVEGIQFHPESVLTPDGRALLSNFCAMLR